jgi:hypothetical protein
VVEGTDGDVFELNKPFEPNKPDPLLAKVPVLPGPEGVVDVPELFAERSPPKYNEPVPDGMSERPKIASVAGLVDEKLKGGFGASDGAAPCNEIDACVTGVCNSLVIFVRQAVNGRSELLMIGTGLPKKSVVTLFTGAAGFPFIANCNSAFSVALRPSTVQEVTAV